MDLNVLLGLLVAVEYDPQVVKTEFLTDGDPDTFPGTLKDLVEFFDNNFISRKDASRVAQQGYTVLYGDCICIKTSKGLVNTGSDNL